MKKDSAVFFDHILESIVLIEEYVSNISEEDFCSDIGVQDKVIRRLSVIGEAVSQIPKEIQERHPEVRWKEIVGMRNFLVHEYFGVSLSEVWGTIRKDIPQLREQILVVQSEEKNQKTTAS